MQRLRRLAIGLVTVAFVGSAMSASEAKAQSTEDRFHDLFVTAGYATAFGAAVGTAFLAWTSDPAANLKYVAMGASLGFIGGSVLGSYIIFSPMISDGSTPTGSTLLANGAMPDKGIVFRPTWDKDKNRIASVEGGMTLFKF
jgi:hypothetical protein